MRIESSFLKSRVARRILILFVACALAPVVTLAAWTLAQVSGEIEDQGVKRLQRACKSHGMLIYGRLRLVDAEMRTIFPGTGSTPLPNGRDDRFRGIAVQTQDGVLSPVFGALPEAVSPAAIHWAHLSGGGTLLLSRVEAKARARIALVRAVDPDDRARGLLVAEIDPAFLFDLDSLGATSVCVLDGTRQVLGTSLNRRTSDAGRYASRTGPGLRGAEVRCLYSEASSSRIRTTKA